MPSSLLSLPKPGIGSRRVESSANRNLNLRCAKGMYRGRKCMVCWREVDDIPLFNMREESLEEELLFHKLFLSFSVIPKYHSSNGGIKSSLDEDLNLSRTRMI